MEFLPDEEGRDEMSSISLEGGERDMISEESGMIAERKISAHPSKTTVDAVLIMK